VRVINVVDLMTLQPQAEHPHGLHDRDFDALFTKDKPIIFAFHGYPSLIHRLTYRRAGHDNLHVRGYKENGTTTTPFDMVVLNDLDRFHLVGDVIDRVASLGSRAAYTKRFLRDKRVDPRPTSKSTASTCRRSATGNGTPPARDSVRRSDRDAAPRPRTGVAATGRTRKESLRSRSEICMTEATSTKANRPEQRILLFLADVDGALVTRDKVLTEDAKDAVRALREAGIEFAITSGRPPRGMHMLVEPLALTTPIAGFNGGVFVNPDLSVIESHTLDPAAARETVTLIGKQGLDVWVYTETEWLVRDPDAPHVAREAWTVKFDARVVPEFTDEHLSRAVKIVGISDDFPRVATCEKAAQAALGERASAARSQPYYLDVTNPKANKGVVVEILSKRLGIPSSQIATMGDMPNDVLMFRNSGFSIAMGNASDEVKAQASAVTDGNEDEGFAKAVRRFILPKDAR
jgi:Cof subfamily protein (haloacid dehalogenase superfamily)